MSALVVAVLAGGRSRRMGAPKALVPFGAGPLIARPLAAARAAGLDAVVVAKPDSPLPALDVPVWSEPAEPVHPLCGLVTALERAAAPVVAVACDQPFLTAELLRAVADTAGNAVCVADGELQPFPGRYEPSALPELRSALERGGPLRAAVAALAPQRLEAPARLVLSVNDPETLDRVTSMPPTAEQWLSAFAAALELPPPTPEEFDELLALAGTAAHASERTAAPVACWLAARAGVSPEVARERAKQLAFPA